MRNCADHVERVVHDQLIGLQGGDKRFAAGLQVLLTLFPLGNVLHHYEEIPRLPILVVNQTSGSRRPDDGAVFANIAFLDTARPCPGVHLLGKAHTLLYVFRSGDIQGCAVTQLIVRVAQHLAKPCVCLHESVIQIDGCHANRRVLENLARATLGRFQCGSAISDRSHFTNAARARDEEKNIFEHYPAGMFQTAKRTCRQHAVN